MDSPVAFEADHEAVGAERSSPTTSATSRRSPRRDRLALLLVYVVSSLFYLWSTTSTGQSFNFGAAQGDDYNELTDGFLSGRLSLPTVASKSFLAIKDPYNPANYNSSSSPYHDLVFYHGHFFLTWGPAPALTLFLPWRILHVGAIPQAFAIWIYCVAALGCSLLLLKLLVDRYFPRVHTWQLTLGAIGLVASNMAAFLLRSPQVYEVSVACSLCFAMAGAYLLASGGLGRYRPWRLAAGSLCLGLAAAGREDDIILGLLVLVVLGLVTRRASRRSWKDRMRLAVPVLAPFLAVCVLLLAYNVARFGSPLQFGEQYQLAGFDAQTTPYYQLSYLVPSLYGYVIDPVRLTLGFPYFVLPPPYIPAGSPASYAPETMGGILTWTPLLLVLFAFPFVLRRKRLPSELAWFTATLATCGALLVFVIAFSIPGGSTRYEADFAALLLLPALVLWYSVSDTARSARRRTAKVIGGAALVYGALAGIAVSTSGYYPFDAQSHPKLATSDPVTYWRLDRFLSPIPTLFTMIAGHPEIATVTDTGGVNAQLGLVNFNAGNNLFFYLSPSATTVEVVSPDSSHWHLAGGLSPGPGNPKGATDILHYRENGVVHSTTLTPGLVKIPLSLHTGLNRIDLWATVRSSTATPAGPFVQVYKLELLK
ncbi:MAG: hypothetical protein JWO62_573 [Acidimicrobiaceae bacterium]|nr:hypothetical protein [Acidimicrobiaceae bacterium]